ncbi:MAG TPA: methyl-accepting chemotaxis protein [Capsulimonadaceae bacterium]
MSILDNIKLAHKLALGFGICLLLAAISVVVAITRMNAMNERTTTIVNVANAESIAVCELAANFRQYRVNQMRFILAHDPKTLKTQKARMESFRDAVIANISTYDKLATDPADRASIDKLKTTWEQCLSFEPAIMEAGLAKKYDVCDTIINKTAEPPFREMREITVAMIDWNAARTKVLARESAATYLSARRAMIVLLLFALICGVLTALVITRTIQQSLGIFAARMGDLNLSFTDLAQSMKALGSGDLTSRNIRQVTHLNWTRKDEFGNMSRVFDCMLTEANMAADGAGAARESLSKLINEARKAADNIAAASEQLAAGNTDLAGRTSSQAASLEETAASMEQMTSIVKQSADNAAQANSAAGRSSTLASAGGEVVESAIKSMASIEDSSRRIAEIVSVIDEIAFQTNLLALNAAVEAARVGEQGRGFAVVASEVRTLAGRSSAAAKQIKSLVDDSVAKVKQGAIAVNKSGDHLRDIVASGKEVAGIVATISSAAQEQAAGIQEVSKAIIQMDDITQKNAALVEEAAAASGQMSEQAHGLASLVRQFKVDETHSPTISHNAAATGTYGLSSVRATGAAKPKLVLSSHDEEEIEEF